MKSTLRMSARIVTLAAFMLCTLSAAAVPKNAGGAESFAGQLLVAASEMRDPRFVETVIYITRHNADGAIGLVINRPIAKGPIADLLKGFGADGKGAKGDIVIHYGGPVSQNQGFVLHSDEVVLESSTKVKDGIAVTSDTKLLQAMARGKGPRQTVFMLGYAGWAPGQLEAELQANSWYVVPGDKELIFGKDADKKWRQAIDKRQIPL